MVSPTFRPCSPTDVDEFLAQASAIASSQGQRLTELRSQVLRLLLEQNEPTKAYDLLALIKGRGIAKPPTVYRALRFLQEVGLVHKIESLNAFVPCGHASHDHMAVFMICDTCGKSEELHAQETALTLKRETKLADFSITRAIIETHGLCGECTK